MVCVRFVVAVSMVCGLMLAASSTVMASVIESDDVETVGESTEEALEKFRQRMLEQRQSAIAEMWERKEFVKDEGGMIPLVVLRQSPGVLQGHGLYGPFPPDPLRRREFDAICDRLGIWDAAARDAIEAMWRNYADRVNRILLERYPDIYRLSSIVAPGEPVRPGSHANVEIYAEMIELVESARTQVTRTEDQLFRALATVDQGRYAEAIESWHQYRRWRRTTIPAIQLSGADIHLSRMLESIGVAWPNPHVRLAYETAIANAAERREQHVLRTAAPLASKQAARFFDALDQRYPPDSPQAREALAEFRRSAQPLRRQRWQRQRDMYAINAEYLSLLSLLLDHHDGERVYDRFVQIAFPEFFPNPYDLRRWFDELLEHELLIRDMRQRISELRQTYVAAQRSVDDGLIRTLHDHDRDFIVARTMSINRDERQRREIQSELQRRYEIAVTFALRLCNTIDDVQELRRIRSELEEVLEVPLSR
jgi:hypothetical protein